MSGTSNRRHIINPKENAEIFGINRTSKEVNEAAAKTGQEVIALCGLKYNPGMQETLKKACDDCLEVGRQLLRGSL